jgi:hypothetical protein
LEGFAGMTPVMEDGKTVTFISGYNNTALSALDLTRSALSHVNSQFLNMKYLSLSVFGIFICLSGVAQDQHEYNGIKAIKELHTGWLVVRLPGFAKKLTAIDSLLANATISDKGRRRLEREKAATLHESELIRAWYPELFDSLYTFSRYAFIFSHETAGFQCGEIPARTSAGKALDSVYLEPYLFASLQGAVGRPFAFTTKDHRDIAYPFPNKISKSGSIWWTFIPVIPLLVSALVLDESSQIRAHRHVERVERKLQRMYLKYYASDLH